MGRPHKEINKAQFEAMCGIMCTQEEIADIFDCHIDTITNWCKREYGMTFSEIYKKKSALGKRSLRRVQFDVATKGNVPMLIWLGKQYLGQKEPRDKEVETLIEDLTPLAELLKGKNEITKND